MIKRLLKIIFLYVPLGYIAASLLLVLILKWMPVYFTPLMIKRSFENRDKEEYVIKKKWMPMENISRNMAKAVIASEDSKFYEHHGFAFEEIRKMRERHHKTGKPIRGCSTISQQTAKNCFTFCNRTWLRKGVETYYTVLIELIWGKERILEVYLNVAEMGVGVFGAEAASQHYYKHPAAKLTAYEAATITCCLPNPIRRSPKWVDKYMSAHRSDIIRYMGYQK